MSYYIYFYKKVIYYITQKLYSLHPANPYAYWFVGFSELLKSVLWHSFKFVALYQVEQVSGISLSLQN